MRPTSIAEILDMRRIIDVTSNAPRGASRYNGFRIEGGMGSLSISGCHIGVWLLR